MSWAKESSIKSLLQVLEEIEYLKESEDLLEKVWLELGAYSQHLSEPLRRDLQNHFRFDDSE